MSQDTHGTPTEGSEPAQASGSDTEGVRMVLWTRRPVCGQRTEIIDRLGALKSAGDIADFTVETWPDEIVMSEHTQHQRVVEQYKEFLLWADEQGVSVSPPFERRTVSPLVGDSRDVLTVPMMCLAVYESDLCGVYPCSVGDRTWRVGDYLDAFETAEGRPPGDADVAVPPVDT